MITLDTSVIIDFLNCIREDLPQENRELWDGRHTLHWDEYVLPLKGNRRRSEPPGLPATGGPEMVATAGPSPRRGL